MCVAVPCKVVRVDGNTAEVDYSGSRVRARSDLVNVRPGDNVLLHAGCILQVISQSEADELAELFNEIKEA